MSSPAPRRHRVRNVLALLAVAYVAECTFVGYTPVKALMTKHLSLSPRWKSASATPVLRVGDSLPLDACIYDSQEMYFFVADCAKNHPLIFRFETATPGVVDVGPTGTVRALHAGRFAVTASSMRRRATLEGVVVPRTSLALSVRDTVLRVGEELVVGWAVKNVDDGPPPIEQQTLKRMGAGADTATTMRYLRWAYPGAARIRAVAPGHDCYRLTSFAKTEWLSVTVVPDDGAARASASADCTASGAPPGRPSVALAAPATPAVDHPRVAGAARRFFAIETCIDSVVTRLGRFPASLDPWRVFGVCLDAPRADPGSSPWHVLDFRSDSTSPWHVFNLGRESGDADPVHVSVLFETNEAEFREGMRRGRDWVDGPRLVLQGDEPQTLAAVVGCAALYRARTGTLAPTLDSLSRFAAAHWREASAGAADGTGCSEARYPRRAAAGRAPAEDPDVIVDESGRFVVRYSAAEGVRGGPVATLRPVRYGETGVVSLRYDPRAGMRRTLADRDATPADAEVVPGDGGSWEAWRFRKVR